MGEIAEQMFVCDELSHLTDLLKVGFIVQACAIHIYMHMPLHINLLLSIYTLISQPDLLHVNIKL